jgi:hypothetical protein
VHCKTQEKHSALVYSETVKIKLTPRSPVTTDCQTLRLGPHERTKCVRCSALCDVRCRHRKTPRARHARTRMLGSIGCFLFLQRMSQSALQQTHFVCSCGPSLNVPRLNKHRNIEPCFKGTCCNHFHNKTVRYTQKSEQYSEGRTMRVAKSTPNGTHALKKASLVDRKRIALSPSPSPPFPSSQTVFFHAEDKASRLP